MENTLNEEGCSNFDKGNIAGDIAGSNDVTGGLAGSNVTGGLAGNYMQQVRPCPTCGSCPTCGRRNGLIQPPQLPIWYTTSSPDLFGGNPEIQPLTTC